MSISGRQEQILELLNENNFLTVEKLASMLYTSQSSIRRDLTKLQSLRFIERTHGGAHILAGDNHAAPYASRMTQNIVGKRKIAKKATELISEGMSVMLDGSSSASFLVPHIARLRNVDLFTNNMLTAINAVNHGIKTHCLGGDSVHNSAVLLGPQTYKIAKEIRPDILFFSSYSLDSNGIISDHVQQENYLRTILIESAKCSVFLCDSEKFNRSSLYTLCTLDDIDVAVFDEPFCELKTKCNIL